MWGHLPLAGDRLREEQKAERMVVNVAGSLLADCASVTANHDGYDAHDRERPVTAPPSDHLPPMGDSINGISEGDIEVAILTVKQEQGAKGASLPLRMRPLREGFPLKPNTLHQESFFRLRATSRPMRRLS